jgi:hypothetical protein
MPQADEPAPQLIILDETAAQLSARVRAIGLAWSVLERPSSLYPEGRVCRELAGLVLDLLAGEAAHT